MDNETSKSDHGTDSNRPETDEEQTSTETSNPGEHSDGSNGGGGEVESMVEGQTQEEHKKTKELLLRAGEFRDASIQIFINRAREKYDKGQEEHGGFLPTDVSFNDLEEEIIDLWFYLQGMKSKCYMLCPEQRDILFQPRVKSVDKTN